MNFARVLYVAEPIDQSDFGVWKASVERMARVAVSRGWLVYRPSTAWQVAKETPIGSEVERVNRFVMARCGAVLAALPAGVPSVGVPREVEWAAANAVPVLVATDHPSWSLYDVQLIGLNDLYGLNNWLRGVENGRIGAGTPLLFHSEGGRLPTRTNDGDAGFDLYVSTDTKIDPGQFVDVPCGIRVALPEGVWGRITGRSSTWRKRKLLVVEGVIDTGFRGLLYAGVTNMGEEPQVIAAGDRVAQLVLHENVAARHVAMEVDGDLFRRIPGDGRGESGFGSSGA